MTTQTSTCGGRIRLDGVTFIEQILVVKLLEQPPQGLNILVVIGDIGIFHIHPIAHLV